MRGSLLVGISHSLQILHKDNSKMGKIAKRGVLTKLQQDRLWDTAFLAPQFLLYFSLVILPFFIAIPIVFTDQVSFIDNDINFIGFQNFINIFKSPMVQKFLPAIKRTAIFMVLNYSTVFIFGMTLALLIYETRSKWRKPFFTVIYLPYMISGLGIGMLLSMLFSRDTGSVNLLLMKIGAIKNAINIKDPAISTWIFPAFIGWRYAGFNMAIFLGGLLSIPSETIDASRVDGVNYFQRLWYIYFPQMIPSIMMATVVCLIGSWGVFDEAVGMGALAANNSVRFVSVLIFQLGFSGTGELQAGTLAEAITMSLVVNVPLLVSGVLLIRLQKKKQY